MHFTTPLVQVVAQMQEKNEELALKSARISEQDLEEMRTEFETRLGTAERKVKTGGGRDRECVARYSIVERTWRTAGCSGGGGMS